MTANLLFLPLLAGIAGSVLVTGTISAATRAEEIQAEIQRLKDAHAAFAKQTQAALTKQKKDYDALNLKLIAAKKDVDVTEKAIKALESPHRDKISKDAGEMRPPTAAELNYAQYLRRGLPVQTGKYTDLQKELKTLDTAIAKLKADLAAASTDLRANLADLGKEARALSSAGK